MSFWSSNRIGTFSTNLLEMPEWHALTKHLSALICLADEGGGVTLEIAPGSTTIRKSDGSDTPADIAAKGPASDWSRIEEGELDWFKATTPGFGEIAVQSSPVFLMRNIKIMWLICDAIRLGGADQAAIGWSPPPKPRHAPTTGRYIDVDGTDTFHEIAGEGPPIFCIHAACQDSLMYRHSLADLSDRYQVIAVDAPGHGKSRLPPSGPLLDLTAQAGFYEQVIETLGVRQPVLIGCSMGGNVALEMAARRPGNYAAIVSAEGADHTPGLTEFTVDMLGVNGHQLLECYARSLTGRRTPPDRAREVIWQISRTLPEIMVADLGGYAGFDQRAVMANIIDPVMLVRGGDDWLVSEEQVVATMQRIPGSTMVTLAGTGHYPMIENPVEFYDAVRQFLMIHGIGSC
jgi:pimeloyl-ACP methyl ester carboxylesterase